jgi:hypothetical protein
MQQPVIDAIGDDFDTTVTSLGAWSAMCIAAGCCPPDMFKLAAG